MTKRGRYVKKARCSFLFFFFSPIEWQIDDTVPSLSGNYYYSVVGRALVLGNAARRKRDEEAKEKKGRNDDPRGVSDRGGGGRGERETARNELGERTMFVPVEETREGQE